MPSLMYASARNPSCFSSKIHAGLSNGTAIRDSYIGSIFGRLITHQLGPHAAIAILAEWDYFSSDAPVHEIDLVLRKKLFHHAAKHSARLAEYYNFLAHEKSPSFLHSTIRLPSQPLDVFRVKCSPRVRCSAALFNAVGLSPSPRPEERGQPDRPRTPEQEHPSIANAEDKQSLRPN